MLRRFAEDRRGHFAMMTAIAIVPILGGLALAIDYAEMNRQQQETLNALDAAAIATARRVAEGATDEVLTAYAQDFFEANLSSVDPDNTNVHLTLPKNNTGGGTLKMSADLKYDPYFLPAFRTLVSSDNGKGQIDFDAHTEVKLKNTLEVALVLDNSGSMDYVGTGSGDKRIDLLKEAAKELIDTLAKHAGQMKQVSKPVQFSLVPFAGSVNVGPDNDTQTWMDQTGVSPIHHENFDWSTMQTEYGSNKKVELSGGVYWKRGTDWGTEKDTAMTRFALYKDMKRRTQTGTQTVQTGTRSVCVQRNRWGSCTQWGTEPVYGEVPVYEYPQYTTWHGCVEARPHPYNVNDAAATVGTPATMFVPMFAPDETDKVDSSKPANNNWLGDQTSSSSSSTRQKYAAKYYQTSGYSDDALDEVDGGPNGGCTTKPITPLVDVSTQAGVDKIKDAIDEMEPLGATNVPEGLAWGWRTVSGGAPFTEGRPDTEKGNDKVVIVLTDGANTYYTPGSVIGQPYSSFNNSNSDPGYGGNDLAGTKAIYSAYGYLGSGHYSSNYTYPRLFQGTTSAIGKSDYSNANYSKALDQQLQSACTNAKGANVVVMTIALDLDATKGTAEQKAMVAAQIAGLQNCASMSRFRNEKLFWNTDGGDLGDTFKKIADELSNLRIVG